ncbi:hypothetical protein [Streptomyces sp. IBSBF 3136]|uniref:hypothetical protein n=1 Tax=Streptomyces sp. IBSBF 3136 TaxID=2903524 RepID=UPI002FDC3CDD
MTQTTETTTKAVICAWMLAVSRPSLSNPISTWAATASTPISAVTRAPAKATVIAGAATSSGPR